jgi:hypothetical protein
VTPDERRHALAFNAVGPAVNEAGCWLPLSARKVVAEAVLAAVDAESASRDATPSVQGYCPACRGESLMLGVGGYVTCRRDDCPDREAATRVLEQRSAVTEVRKLVAWVPACPTRRHTAHPGHTCEEADAAADRWAEICNQAGHVFDVQAADIPAALRGPDWKAKP